METSAPDEATAMALVMYSVLGYEYEMHWLPPNVTFRLISDHSKSLTIPSNTSTDDAFTRLAEWGGE